MQATVEKVLGPWKKAVQTRDEIIERVVTQRDKWMGVARRYRDALKERDDIIRDLAEERDQLKARLEAINNSEKPEDPPRVEEVEPDLNVGEPPPAPETKADPGS